MAVKQGGGKKKRAQKTSKGVHSGGGKVSLTRLQLALMGKGPSARAAELMNKRAAVGKTRERSL